MKYPAHIVTFKGRLVTLDFFTDKLVEFMKSHAIDYYLVDTNIPETYNCADFDRYIEQPGVVMFTFNNIGVRLDVNGENIWKSHGIQVYNFVVDPPRAFPEILLHPVCDMHVINLDQDRADFVKEFYPEVKSSHFFPAGGAEIDSSKPFSKRSIDVIYMGSCQAKVTDFPVISYLPDGGRDMYGTCIRSMISDHRPTTENTIRNYLSTNGYALTHDELFDILITATDSIENYARRYYKLQGMYALDQAGVHVDVWGKNWEDDEFAFSDNIRIHERITPEELLGYCGDAKISLVFMGWQKRGCSEKNFDSMMNGCLCVTDTNTYIEDNYKDGQNIIYFDLHNPAQMAMDIKYLLEHYAAAELIAQSGYRTCKKHDSWEVRYDQILQMIAENEN